MRNGGDINDMSGLEATHMMPGIEIEGDIN